MDHRAHLVLAGAALQEGVTCAALLAGYLGERQLARGLEQEGVSVLSLVGHAFSSRTGP